MSKTAALVGVLAIHDRPLLKILAGYLPAEHIETPTERLARLNKHRNIDLSATMLGDTAIAVHPNDERYKHLVGKKAKHPFLDRLLSIVADDYVDPEFGTGAVKITPAHDPNDFSLGQRHNLEFINILNDDGTMNNNTGKFEGQKRFDVRYAVTDELEKLGLLVKKEDNPMKVPLCAKSKDVIEPLMKPQWWMKMKGLAEPAMKAVRDGEITISPPTSEKMYFHWMENSKLRFEGLVFTLTKKSL